MIAPMQATLWLAQPSHTCYFFCENTLKNCTHVLPNSRAIKTRFSICNLRKINKSDNCVTDSGTAGP